MEGQTTMAKIKHDPRGELIAKQLMESYDPKSAQNIQDIFKTIFGPMFESMLKVNLKHTLVILIMTIHLKKLTTEEMVPLQKH